MESRSVTELGAVRRARDCHCFAVQADLRLLDADAYIIPTDSFGTVEPAWEWAVGVSPSGSARQLHEEQRLLTETGFVWVDSPTGRSVLALDVAGDGSDLGVGPMVERLRAALAALEARGLSSDYRARPLVAMPLIGVGKAGHAGRTGEVIAALLDAVDDHFSRFDTGSFDLVIATRDPSSIAALQHERRTRIPAGELEQTPRWLIDLVNAARSGRLAVMFGAGASAALGLPMWKGLLDLLVENLQGSDLTASDLARLDPTDAATLLIEAGGEEWFDRALGELLGTSRFAVTHALMANLRPPLAITTNYDQAYEAAAATVFGAPAVVLPWDSDEGAGARVLKLHGDLTRGQLVLSRDQFVAMHAYRRPLAGVLQSRMLIGHLLAVGTSMSDATLVHAAEEFHALIRQARAASPTSRDPNAGTVVLTRADPARARLLGRAFTVVSADDPNGVLESARDIDVLLDWLVMQSSSDLSFALDSRYEALLGPSDLVLATALRNFVVENRTHLQSEGSDLARAVNELLSSLGMPEGGTI